MKFGSAHVLWCASHYLLTVVDGYSPARWRWQFMNVYTIPSIRDVFLQRHISKTVKTQSFSNHAEIICRGRYALFR